MKENPKLLWSYAKSRLKNKEQISTLIALDGTVAASPQAKAEALNEFFASVFTVEDLNTIPPALICNVEEEVCSIRITPDVVKVKVSRSR